jgi:membrane-associated protease RseP (regulator of RpoE activity)
VTFSGEELGDVGSTAFTRTPPGGLVLKDVVAMLNMDMVGRMRDDLVQVLGIDTAAEWGDLVMPACARAGVDCKGGGGGYGPSDHTPFYAAGIPVLHFFTGSHADYHKPTDDTALINAAGGAQVAQIVGDVAFAVAARPAALVVKASPAPEPIGDLRNTGASLGTVPDYVGPANGATGVLLAGVRPGGPAETAGMQRGDILVKIDGHDIKNVEDFMFVLENAKPGGKAKITVLRGGKPVQLEAVYGQSTMH